jgi:hypothetical protein
MGGKKKNKPENHKMYMGVGMNGNGPLNKTLNTKKTLMQHTDKEA